MKRNYTIIISIFFIILIESNILFVKNGEFGFQEYTKSIFELVVIAYFSRISKDNKEMPANKNCLYAFLVTAFNLILLVTICIPKLEPTNSIRVLVAVYVILSTILIMKVFKIKILDFNFKFNTSDILQSLIISGGFLLLSVYNKGIDKISYISIFTVINFIYVAFIEESIFRGVLINGLKSYDISNWAANIIQSIIFGLFHIHSYGVLNIYSLLGISYQVLFGFMVGIIYLKRKTLTSPIIIHTLFNIANTL